MGYMGFEHDGEYDTEKKSDERQNLPNINLIIEATKKLAEDDTAMCEAFSAEVDRLKRQLAQAQIAYQLVQARRNALDDLLADAAKAKDSDSSF